VRRRFLATAAAAVSMAAGAALPAAADADPFLAMPVLGVLAIEPTTGDLETPITFTTAGGCPHGTNSITRVYGDGFPAEGENVIGNTEVYAFGSPPNDRMTAPMTITLAEAVRRQADKVDLNGTYTFRFSCQDALPPGAGGLYGAYVGEMTIADGTFTATTTSADLPSDPTPKAGKDALEAQIPKSDPSLRDPEQLDEQGRAAREAAAAELAAARGDTNSWAVPLAAGGGFVVLGLGSMLVASRRSTRTSAGSRK
jgi:hypothetical protein